jgi:hypothetical protein
VGGSSLEDVNNMVFNSSNPGQGASIDFASTATRFVRFSTSDDESQQIAGTTGSGNNLYNSGRITQANIVCPSTDFIYTMIPCPNQSQTSNFTASSPNQLTIGATYEVGGSQFTNIIATVQQETVGTPQATIVGAADCPGPTITAIELVDYQQTSLPQWKYTYSSPGYFGNYNSNTTQVVWLDIADPRLTLRYDNKYVINNNLQSIPYNNLPFYPCDPARVSSYSTVSDCNTYPALDVNQGNQRAIISFNSMDPSAKPVQSSVVRTEGNILNTLNPFISSSQGSLDAVSYAVIFDYSTVTGGGNDHITISEQNNPQNWNTTSDSSLNPNAVPYLVPVNNSEMFYVSKTGGGVTTYNNQVRIRSTKNNNNIGSQIAANIQLTLLNNKSWTSGPTFSFQDFSTNDIPVDPTNNQPILQIRSTALPNALLLQSVPSPASLMDIPGGHIRIRVDGSIA